MNRLSRVGIAVVLLAGVLWAGGVAEARREPSAVKVCVEFSSGKLRSVASAKSCVGRVLNWSVAKPAPLLCWNASSKVKFAQKRLVSVAPKSGCAAPNRAVPNGKAVVLCTDSKSGVLRWPATGVCASGNQQVFVRSVTTTSTTTTTTAATIPATTSTLAVTTTTATIPATTSTLAVTTTTAIATTTTVLPTCAQGGSCTVGIDVGPGGGTVFYYSASAFTSEGSPCNTNCHYLEVAPITGSFAWTDVFRSWATDVNSNWINLVVGPTGTGVGLGNQNTLAVIAQAGNVAATSAAVEARAYRGPTNLSDWFLPSKDELNELCKYAKNTEQAAGGGTVCTGGSAATLRGFSTERYWSSSDPVNFAAWFHDFSSGYQTYESKDKTYLVRPVRAF